MLNAEKFRDEILKITNGNFPFGISKTTNEIQPCHLVGCSRCLFEQCIDRCYKKRFEWLLSEYQEPPILDEVEREYLSAVCRPYKVETIYKKTTVSKESQCLEICTINTYLNGYEYIHLPYFNANTMYKGMELCKEYTPQELGIKCRNNPNGEIKHD